MSKPIPQRQGKGSNPNNWAALVRHPFKARQSGNPGGSPKGTPRVDVAYKRLLAMAPEELAIWEPRNGAEIMAAEQFKRACNPNVRQTLNDAERITDRTDGPIVRKVQKEDMTRVRVERQRFEAAIDLLVEEYSISRADAAANLVEVEPSFRKFVEPGDDST